MAKKKTQEGARPVIVRGFKGFNADMTCRGMQYEVGKTYEESEASLCNKGLHFCEYPLDCFDYYEPANSVYAEVEAESPSDETDSDTKRVTKKLAVKGMIGISGLVQAAVNFVIERSTTEKGSHATGDRGAASSTGDRGAASATGKDSVAMACGYRGKAKASDGSWIVLAERNNTDEIITMRCAQAGKDGIKPDTYYRLENGEFVEA